MGGKTHQRVAGNAKPSSSGRIQELLINKQQGVGQVVTFSVLASAKKPTKQQPPPTAKQNQEKVAAAEAEIAKDKSLPAAHTDCVAAPSQREPAEARPATHGDVGTPQPKKAAAGSPEKVALVVRRVGNRDLFTRVRVTEDVDAAGNQNVINVGKTGIYLPPPELLTSTAQQEPQESLNEASPEESDNSPSPEPTTTRDPCEDYDFDTMLDQLEIVKAKVAHHRRTCNTLDDLTADQAEIECQLVKLLRVSVAKFKDDLSVEEWDLVNTCLYTWIGWILGSEWSSNREGRLAEAWRLCAQSVGFLCRLLALGQELQAAKDKGELESPMLRALLDDWANFQDSQVYKSLIVLYFQLANRCNVLSAEEDALLEALAQVVLEVDPKTVILHTRALDYVDRPTIEFDSDFNMPIDCRYCTLDEAKSRGFLAICSLLKSHNRVVLVSAHSMLSKLIEKVGDDVKVEPEISESDDIDEIPILPPPALMSILTTRDPLMAALLSDYKAGDISVTIDPSTDSYACALSYLFVWDLIVQFIVNIHKEVGHRVVHCFKRLGLTQRLLDNIFMLLPPLGERNLLNLRSDTGSTSQFAMGSGAAVTNLTAFLKAPLKMSIPRAINEIELTALHLYFSIALHFPVTIRKWFINNSNKRLSNLVNEYTVKHVSQAICSIEMESVQDKCRERSNDSSSKEARNNLVIKARPTAREVYAVYTRDEFKMELTIKLPANYPLGSVQIDGGKRVGVSDVKWRSWLLQLTTFLAHQNGPILDGIDLWRRNIDKRFEGIEKCTICFSILHSNYQLPKKKCQTCTKMFHNLCLYKWFESSGNSTCPLCRNTWR